MRGFKGAWIVSPALCLAFAGAVILVVALVLPVSPAPRRGYVEPRLRAAFHEIGVGDTTTYVRKLMGNPDYVSKSRQALLRLTKRPSTRRAGIARFDVGSAAHSKVIRSVAVESWYFGGILASGSYELDFANGKLAAKYRY
jgi:hypothetical protein